jgi:peptidylamidoglycolate lyase
MVRSLVLLLVLVACRTPAPSADAGAGALGARTGTWRRVEGWPALPAGFKLGQVSGVAIDRQGHVMVFHRAGREFDRKATEAIAAATVLELEPASGRLLNAWGAGLFLIPHSVTVDASNNVWLTDVGRHQAFKFSHDGALLLTVGERRVAGWDATHFNEPTDIAIAADGSFYVSDGYQNARVAHFDAAGGFLGEWGKKGTAPGEFRVPHGLALDGRGHILVADRENQRLQAFDTSGKFMTEWPTGRKLGRVFAAVVSPSGQMYVACKDSAVAVVVLDRDFHPVSQIPFDSALFVTPHAIAVSGDSVLYIADTGGARIVKYARRAP